MAASTLPLIADQFTGRKLGKYEIICRLSTGGMSLIFLAFQRGLAGFRKLVVLKQILPDIRGEEEFVRMFLDEAKITAAFNHSNIAQVYDLDVQEGELFLAMEFVPGATLVEVAKACRANSEPIPTGFTLTSVRDTALALHYAHTFTDPIGRQQTVIHRDVAEKNIMVTFDGTTKLLDFGIAKSLAHAGRTTVGMVKGTSGYMSPEQILGEKLDPRSDIFSLGVVLHECLTGMRLFHGKSPEEGMIAALKEPVAPPSRGNSQVSPELDAVVLKALARKRDDRFANAREFARAIERAAGDLLWEQDSVAPLMQRLFVDRRDQTRALLGTLEGARDITGEHQLRQLLGEESLSPPPLRAVPTPPPPPPMSARRTSGAGVEPPPRRPSPVSTSTPRPPASVQVSPAVTAFPGKSRPSQERAGVITQAGRAADLPWQDESTSGSEPGEVPTVPPNVPLTPKYPEESEGLTIPLASLPKGLFDPLPTPAARRSGERKRIPTVSEQTLSEDTTPGVRAPRRRGRVVSAALFLTLMLAVFFAASFALGVHRRLGFAAAPAPAPSALEPTPLVDPAQLPKPAQTEAPKQAAVPAQKSPPQVVPSPKPAAPVAAEVRRPSEAPRPKPVAPAEKEEDGSEEDWEAPTLAVEGNPAKPAAEVVAARKKAKEEPAGSSGLLTLVTEPYAKVMLKTQDLGTTPLFKYSLPSGRHTLRLVGADQRVFLLPVEIKEGETQAVRVTLEQLQPE